MGVFSLWKMDLLTVSLVLGADVGGELSRQSVVGAICLALVDVSGRVWDEAGGAWAVITLACGGGRGGGGEG